MPPRAFLFDVFGTVVDWRRSVMADLEAVFAPKGVAVDWHALALGWRALYQPAMERIRSGAREYVRLDVLHRENLEKLIIDKDLPELSDVELQHLTLAWHRLAPWPDSADGLARLHRIAPVAALSNGNIALMVNLARHAGLRWDAILGAETARAYKPDPRVYLGAAEALGLRPADCMMVAAHNDDLRAAAALGLRTAFVLRPEEYGPGQERDLAPEADWDHATNSLTGLADRLAA